MLEKLILVGMSGFMVASGVSLIVEMIGFLLR